MRKFHKTIVWLTLICMLSGCTSLVPVQGSPEQLQQRVASSALIKAGDAVRIVAHDGEVLRFKVSRITKDAVIGANEEVPIDQIATLERREFSAGKTTALVAVLFLALAAVVADDILDTVFFRD